ncbi:MAG: ATP-binding cassette domain-containing protein [Leptospirales bacterium]|jgi:ABC-2 type transport system ATP-binding protein
MIEVQGLCKNYGDFQALQNASFRIAKNQGITALLGPNGAGKTTTMRLMTGYLEPSAGEILIDGRSVRDARQLLEIKRRVGYLPESSPLYPEMLVSEFLEFTGRVRGLDGADLETNAREMIDKLELGSHLYSPIGILSKGFRQRVALAATLIHKPEVIILDEPTSGLDPNQIVHIRSLIRELGAGSTLILSTHILQEVEDICDRVIIVNRGRIVADQATSALRSAGEVRVIARGADIQRSLASAPGVKQCREISDIAAHMAGSVPDGFGVFLCELGPEDPPEKLFAHVAAQGWDIREFAPMSRSLEEIFAELTAD